MKKRFTVLGIPIDAVQIPDVLAKMSAWIDSKSTGHYITVNAMHSILAAYDDPQIMAAQAKASLCVPDGKPLILIGRWKGQALPRRVYGPDLMLDFCRETKDKYRHFFYGGTPGVAELVAKRCETEFGTKVCGTYTPPFSALGEDEMTSVTQMIHNARPDVVWVGLSSPKQELLMARVMTTWNVPVMVGVGAAFDFNAGIKKQAPRWIGEFGWEWLFRLATEPRRLGPRYLRGGFRFLYLCLCEEILGAKKKP